MLQSKPTKENENHLQKACLKDRGGKLDPCTYEQVDLSYALALTDHTGMIKKIC